jgi:Raf kinase inhibitor-like YbhB/YbcL family protein
MKGGYSISSLRQITGLLILLGFVVASLIACEAGESIITKEGEMALSVSSPAFQEGESIPTKYTCEGQNISPLLTWSEPPAGTQSLALIVDDPDAPGRVFTHWVLFNLPADSRELAEAMPVQAQLPDGSLQGKNDGGKLGYIGPCPPPGSPHRYQFTLYALDQLLDLEAGASKQQVIDAMQGHILAQGQLTGIYQR